MIYSMTAFARAHLQQDWGQAVWEIRTVNHRYLDISLRLPDLFREWEPVVREMLAGQLHRGKVECQLRFSQSDQICPSLQVNMALVDQLVQACIQVESRMKTHSPCKATDILRWPDVLQTNSLDIAPLKTPVLNALKQCLSDLTTMRAREGAALSSAILHRLTSIQSEINTLSPRLPVFVETVRQKLKAKVVDLQIGCDPLRLEQEVVLLAQKADVAEEIDRLQTHVKEVRHWLEKGGELGRKLDFLMQELNREANTLTSKSTDPDITRSAVEIKVLIEQMREQIQNIV